MFEGYEVIFDGFNSHRRWEENYYETEKEFLGDVWAQLAELGGGHAEIWDADGYLVREIEM